MLCVTLKPPYLSLALSFSDTLLFSLSLLAGQSPAPATPMWGQNVPYSPPVTADPQTQYASQVHFYYNLL